MNHQLFLSYPIPNQDLVENFADHLSRNGVKAWVYSIDKTLSVETWEEIETRIDEADLFAFVASVHSCDAKGQHRELQMAVEKLVEQRPENNFRLLPIVLDNLPFRNLPPPLNRYNGVRLSGYNVASVAQEVARGFYPNLFGEERDKPWRCPKPGQWLEVRKLDQLIEEYFEQGDLLYFRRLSPLGLFECYSPKLDELFWISPEDVRASGIPQDACPSVPLRFRYMTSYEYEMLGRDVARENKAPGA